MSCYYSIFGQQQKTANQPTFGDGKVAAQAITHFYDSIYTYQVFCNHFYVSLEHLLGNRCGFVIFLDGWGG
jgi:hypothetical protein